MVKNINLSKELLIRKELKYSNVDIHYEEETAKIFNIVNIIKRKRIIHEELCSS